MHKHEYENYVERCDEQYFTCTYPYEKHSRLKKIHVKNIEGLIHIYKIEMQLFHSTEQSPINLRKQTNIGLCYISFNFQHSKPDTMKTGAA